MNFQVASHPEGTSNVQDIEPGIVTDQLIDSTEDVDFRDEKEINSNISELQEHIGGKGPLSFGHDVPFGGNLEYSIEDVEQDETNIVDSIETGKGKKKKVRFLDESIDTSKVMIGGVEHDTAGFAVFEIQQRGERAKNDPSFDPLEMYGGQVYTDINDITLKVIKKSKIGDLYKKSMGGLANVVEKYEQSSNIELPVLPLSAGEIKNSDIEDIEHIKSSLQIVGIAIGGKSDPIMNKSAGRKLRLDLGNKSKAEILKLEKKSIPIIRKAEKSITKDIEYVESITEELERRIKNERNAAPSCGCTGGDIDELYGQP